MSDWVAFCGEKSQVEVRRAVEALDGAGALSFARSADGLRRIVFESAPGELGAVVGPSESGVSDVNLAAAVANDGNARCVVLARGAVSGSLRSRASRAGIDLVVDLDELGEGGGAEPRGDETDGGPRARPPAPPLPPAPGTSRGEGDAAAAGGVAAPGRVAVSGRAPVVTFCSGRGGVGKTAVVATAAAQAALWGMRVCALDLDLSCGNLYTCFGLPFGFDFARLRARGGPGAASVGGARVEAAPGLNVLGPCERPETAELVMPDVSELIARLCGACDLVLVDTSTTFTDAVAQAAQLADRLVLVSDGRAGSVASLARMGGLAVRLGVARTRIARLENRANPRARADFALARAEVGLEAARVFRAFEGGAEATDLLASGQALDLAESGSAFAESVAVLLAQILAELGQLPAVEAAQRAAAGDTTGRRRGLFGRLREAR